MGVIKPVDIGGVMVGDGYPTVFVAEIGTFFNKDIELAHTYLETIAMADAPVFKTEILHDADICLKKTGLLHEYQHAAGVKIEDYRSLIERKINSFEDYQRLFDHCKSLNIPFLATVYDFEGVDFLLSAGGAAFKIARDNINNIPLIRRAARTGLPIIFDAGVVYFDEIARAVRLAQHEGASGVVVNHHPGQNPAAPDVHNMCIMDTYKRALKVPVGLSCHYQGEEILYLAVGMGANLLEKGVDDNPDRAEQDLISASRLRDIKKIIRRVNNCWQAIGKAPAAYKEPRDFSVRKGIIAKHNLFEGDTLTEGHLKFAWPPLGISVENWDRVVGAKVNRAITALEPIKWEDLTLES